MNIYSDLHVVCKVDHITIWIISNCPWQRCIKSAPLQSIAWSASPNAPRSHLDLDRRLKKDLPELRWYKSYIRMWPHSFKSFTHAGAYPVGTTNVPPEASLLSEGHPSKDIWCPCQRMMLRKASSEEANPQSSDNLFLRLQSHFTLSLSHTPTPNIFHPTISGKGAVTKTISYMVCSIKYQYKLPASAPFLSLLSTRTKIWLKKFNMVMAMAMSI